MPGALAHDGVGSGIGGEGRDGGGEFLISADEAGFAVVDDAGRTAVRRDDSGDTGGERLEHYVAEGVGVRGKDEGVHVGIGAGQLGTAEDAGELGADEAFAQPRPSPP